MSRFQLCHECYLVEAAVGVAGAKGLPAGMIITELVAEHVEAIPPTSDEGNPTIESEFFDTRQVQHSFSLTSRWLPNFFGVGLNDVEGANT